MRLLLIDSSRDDRFLIAREIRREDARAEVVDVETAEELTRALEVETPDVVVIEPAQKWADGVELVRRLRTGWPRVPVFAFTDRCDEGWAVALLRAGARSVIQKGRERLPRLGAAVRAAAEDQTAAAAGDGWHRGFFESLPVPLYLSLPDGTLVGANAALIELLGFENAEELRGIDLRELYVEPTHRDQWLEKLLRDGVVSDFVSRLRRRDGSQVWVRETSRAMWSDDGQSVVVQGTMEDVSERREAERALEGSRRRYETLVESAQDSVLLIEGDRIVDCNSYSCRLFGYPREELLGLRPDQLSPPMQPGGQPSSVASVERMAAALDGDPQRFEWRHRRADGSCFDAEIGLNRLELEHERFLLATVRDLSQERAAADALQRRDAILEALTFAATRFLRPESWEGAVDEVLGRLGRAAAVSRAYLLVRDEPGSGSLRLSQRFEWAAEGVQPQSGDPRLEAFDPVVRGLGALLEPLLEGRMVSGTIDALPETARVFFGEAGVQSIAIVPVFVDGEPWGCIGFDDCSDRRRWSQGELDALRAAADILAAAVSADRTRSSLQARTEELEVVARVNGLLAGTLDAATVMQEIAAAVRGLGGVEHVAVTRVDEEERTIRFLGWSGYDNPIQSKGLALDAPGVMARVARTGEPCYVPDVRSDAEYLPGSDEVASEYAVPLVWAGRVLGVLNAESTRRDGISTRKRRLIDRLAAQAAVGLANADAVRRLEDSEGSLRDLVDSIEDIICVLDLDGRILDLNRAATDVLGYTADEIVGRSLHEVVAARYLGEVEGYLEEVRTHGRVAGLMRIVAASGDERLIECRSTLRQDGVADPVIRAMARDVTEKWRAERAIRRFNLRLDALREIDRAVLAGHGVDRIAEIALAALRRIAPCPRASVVLIDHERGVARRLAVDDELPERLTAWQERPIGDLFDLERLALRRVHRIDELATMADPPPVLIELQAAGFLTVVTVTLVVGERLLGSINLMSDRSGAFSSEHEEVALELADELSLALRQTQLTAEAEAARQRLQAAVEHLPEGVVVLDHGLRVLLANAAARHALPAVGRLDADGRLWQLGRVPVEESLDRARRRPLEIRVAEEGRERLFEIRAREMEGDVDLGWVVVLEDVTAEREAERQQRLQQRLVAVGQLAAGIAHDFNNILQAVELNAELIYEGAPRSELQARVEAIHRQADRGAALIRQILDFARKTVTQPQAISLAPFVRETIELLRRTIPESIELRFESGPEEALVMADPGQVQQVVTNLVMNARDAMPRGGAATVRLDVCAVEPGAESGPSGLGPGRWAVLTVEDVGHGIPAAVRDRIFEPFFTTKEPGQGTGLGLPQVYGIVSQHGGQVTVRSLEGVGTTVAVALPVVGAASSGVLTDPAAGGEETPIGTGELVLVAEDDPAVLEIARAGLERLGYRVLSAADGASALELAEREREELRLVLSDVVMPGLGGVELARRLEERGVGAKVLLMTGYPLARSDQPEPSISDWLQKPFSMAQLGRAVARALHGD